MVSKPLAVAAVLSTLALQASGQEQTILFDLGSSTQRTAGLVNNTTSPGEVGVLVENAQDSDGYLTTVALRQSDGWSGINLKGSQADGPYPAQAMRDSFYLGDGDDRAAKMHIDGLTPGEKYTFTFFASRMESTINRVARYTIGERVAELDASNNTSARVSIADAAAGADGSVTIDVECAEEGGHAYLGVLEIKGAFSEGTLSREPPDPLDGPPPVSAKAWAIADGKTGEVLWGLNEDEPRKIASTTKIMCAWVVIQLAAADPAVLDEVVTFSRLADETGGSTAGVREGEQVRVGELLYGLLLPSGNDAGNALAEHFNDRLEPPEDPELRDSPDLATRANFVAEMNRHARRLGMANTTYRIPYGDGGTASQFTSTARDLLRLAWSAMQEPLFRQYVSTRRYRCVLATPDGGERVVVWRNTNQLLAIEGYEGVKTGTTGQAGACLVSSGRRGEDHLLVAVLGSAASPCRYYDTRNLFRWAWLERGHRPD
ncbi:MAG: D-alanyl-D-alanine carboxypeptidase family protein [Armatimonadota bacterium]